MSDSRKIFLGVACGVGTGALWGVVFLAPALVQEFNPIWLTIARYLFYGVFSLLLVMPLWRRLLPQLGRKEWFALGWLAFFGNVFYYLLLANAVQLGGIAMASLVLGFLPVIVTLVGSRHQGAVPLRQLWPSMLLCIAGTVCVGWQALVVPEGSTLGRQLLGFACAVGALFSWTSYAVGNRRWLTRLEKVSVHEWNLLLGVVTCAQTLLLVPVALWLYGESHSAVGWAKLAGVAAGVAVLASMIGNALWNQASRLLPLTLVGQMIVFETVFALLYGFLWEWRWPTALEAVAFVLVVLSVVSCVGAHAGPAKQPPAHAT